MAQSALQAASRPGSDVSVDRIAEAWMQDPYAWFGSSNTAIHSFSWQDAEPVLLAAFNRRLAERREQIPVLARLADGQGIDRIHQLGDAAALLFEHTVYKSYPISLLAKQRFDQLNRWIGKLTPHDLSGVDVSACRSIDEWLTVLQEKTPLDVGTSSGSSGTMSFFPKSKADYRMAVRGFRVQLIQAFGQAPSEADLHDKITVMTPMYRDGHSSAGRFAPYLRDEMCNGDDAYLYTAFAHKISSDLMWLGARLRAAAAKGDVSRVDVPAPLLERREELERWQREAPAQQSAFIRRMATELQGRRVFAMGTSQMFYNVAKQGLEDGVRKVFSPGSRLMGGGGAKGMALPDDLEPVLKDFFGVPRVESCYGMTELNSFSMTCEHGRYHLLPWLALFVLDIETGRALPRSGTQTGRAAFFDMTHDGTWGGIITGDEITVDWSQPCACGRKSISMAPKIQRIADSRDGDDKITCAATPQAHAEAMDYLTRL